MKKLLTLIAAFMLLAVFGANAAMFEASPTPLQESSPNVVITFHADQSGVSGLMNLSTDLYVHIGVYTNKSPNSWVHTSKWGDNAAKYLLKRVSTNTFQLTIGDMRTYFGITDASEHITNICIIARNAAANVQTKDQFIDVAEDGFAMSFASNPSNTTILKATNITFTASTSQAADKIQILVDNSVVKEATNATQLVYSQTFNNPGKSNIVKAVATKGSETCTEEINVFYVSASPQQNYPGGVPRQGAVKNSDGSVTFCLLAPGKSSVTIIGSWDDYAPVESRLMKYQDYNGYRYFWTTVSGLDNTKAYPYYYLIDGTKKVGDPYAHLTLDPYQDKWLKSNVYADRPPYPYDKFDDIMLGVYKGNIDDYNWKVKDFAATNPLALTNRDAMVVYELLFRDFTGTDSKDDGTVREAIKKIPYLKAMGITAVELMPIMQFDGNNSWGYNTTNYMAPDKSYGSPDDYKEFIDICHQNGIAVILDIVFNHVTGLHPWYQMYDAGTSPFLNAKCPHDYGVYNDVKQEYAPVEQHWVDVLTYWMTAYKADGFRFDLVKGLGDTNSYGSGTEAYNQSRINRMARLHAAMKKVNPNVIHINEHLAGASEEKPMGQDGQLLWNNQNWHAGAFAKCQNSNLKYMNSAECSRTPYSTVDYGESHDEQRLGWYARNECSNANVKSSEALRMDRLGSIAAQMLMMPGPKMIWQFGEFGNEETTKDSNGGNDTRPKKVDWGALNNANRAALQKIYTDLCQIRRLNPEMFSNGTSYSLTGYTEGTGVRSLRLNRGTKEIVLLVNPNPTTAMSITATCTRINEDSYQVLAASKGFTPSVAANVRVTVPANSFCVLGTPNVAGIEEIEIDDIIAAANRVYGVSGRIVIEGEYTTAAVYTLAGQQLDSLDVAPGLYMVVVDGVTHKVLVK